MDISVEENNSDNEFDISNNNDYNLNIIYEEVIKNLEDFNISKDNIKDKDNEYMKKNLVDSLLNKKAKKE